MNPWSHGRMITDLYYAALSDLIVCAARDVCTRIHDDYLLTQWTVDRYCLEPASGSVQCQQVRVELSRTDSRGFGSV